MNNVDIDQTNSFFHFTSVDCEPCGMSVKAQFALHSFIGVSIKHLVV